MGGGSTFCPTCPVVERKVVRTSLLPFAMEQPSPGPQPCLRTQPPTHWPSAEELAGQWLLLSWQPNAWPHWEWGPPPTQLPQLKEAGLGSPQLVALPLEARLVLLLLVQQQHQVTGLSPEIHPLMAEKPKPAGPPLLLVQWQCSKES